MINRLTCPTLALATVLTCSTPAIADDAKRSGEQTVGATKVQVSYETGLLRIRAENFPTLIGDALSVPAPPTRIDGQMSRDCGAPSTERRPSALTASATGQSTLDPGRDYDYNVVGDATTNGGALTVEYYDEQALSSVQWRCADLKVDGIPFVVYFEGYAAFTPTIAEQHVKAHLKSLYPAELIRRLVYLECPEEEFAVPLGEDSTSSAICQYQIGRGSRVRSGVYSVTAEPDNGVVAERLSNNTYSQRLVNCPSRYERSETYNKRVRITDKSIRAPRVYCSANFISLDLARSAIYARKQGKRTFRAGLHGTNRAGFEEEASFPCRFTTRKSGATIRYRLRCANQLGDVVVYEFSTITKPKVRAKPRPTRRPSGGGGGGQYDGKTCSEIGHPFNVTPGSDPEHDRDGDGIACESE